MPAYWQAGFGRKEGEITNSFLLISPLHFWDPSSPTTTATTTTEKEGCTSDTWKLLKFNHHRGKWAFWKRRRGKATPDSKAEPNGPSGPEQWHHVPLLPTSHTPQLIARQPRVSVRKAVIITGNKHLNTCAFLPQNMAPHKGESSWTRTCRKGSLNRRSSLLCFHHQLEQVRFR